MPCTTPQKLTPITHCHARCRRTTGRRVPATPALLHTTCTAPKRSIVAAASASTCSTLPTSVRTRQHLDTVSPDLGRGRRRAHRPGRRPARASSRRRRSRPPTPARCRCPPPVTTATVSVPSSIPTPWSSRPATLSRAARSSSANGRADRHAPVLHLDPVVLDGEHRHDHQIDRDGSTIARRRRRAGTTATRTMPRQRRARSRPWRTPGRRHPRRRAGTGRRRRRAAIGMAGRAARWGGA